MNIRTCILVIAASVSGLSLDACHTARAVSINNVFHTSNTISERGFTYAKKGVEVRYVVEGIFPSRFRRPELLAELSVAHNAYARLWKAAGGLKDNQRFVNLVIESSFVKKLGAGGGLFLVVHVISDVVELDGGSGDGARGPGATRPTAPEDHPLAAQLIRQIEQSVLRAAARFRS